MVYFLFLCVDSYGINLFDYSWLNLYKQTNNVQIYAIIISIYKIHQYLKFYQFSELKLITELNKLLLITEGYISSQKILKLLGVVLVRGRC